MVVCPAHNQGTLIEEERAIWNPLCAGLSMQYICFFGNLDCGMTMIDSFAQLRMVLHLFNAYVQIGAIGIGEIPFLDWLFDTFKDCKAVWEGPIPKKGEFVKRWWISYGASIPKAKQLATVTHTRLRGRTNSSTTSIRPPPRLTYRDMTPIKAEDIAKSYRRVCLHDFEGVEDQYHADAQRERNKGSQVYEFAVRSNDTMDSMESEQQMLASNFAAIGSNLNHFFVTLFDVLKWTSQIDQIIAATADSIKAGRRVNGTSVHPQSWEASDTNMRRYNMATLLAEQLLGPLDVVFDEIQFQSRSIITRTIFFLQFFFEKISPNEVQFFTPTEFEDENKKVAANK